MTRIAVKFSNKLKEYFTVFSSWPSAEFSDIFQAFDSASLFSTGLNIALIYTSNS